MLIMRTECKGGKGLFEIISSLLKYIFTIIIYLFIFGIIRLIYLDIRSINMQKAGLNRDLPYLKLINQRESLAFKVEETYVLNDSLVIGRSDKSNIVIKDPFISGKHAQFVLKDGRYRLEDLGSTNGTFINGSRIDKGQITLKDGDKVRVGQVEFLFVHNNRRADSSAGYRKLVEDVEENVR